MNNVVPLANKRDWKWHRDRIAKAWGTQVENIIDTGRCVFEAQDELGEETFRSMAQTKLPFEKSTAYALIKIYKHPIIGNVRNCGHLPPSIRTLEDLTRVPDDILMAKLKDGSIHPKLQRNEARAMRPGAKAKPKPATREEIIAAIQKDPTANQREAADALNISLGMYQRTRNELIGSGEVKGALTLDDLRERAATLLRDLPKEERMREITRTMKAVGLNIHDWVSTMTIGKKGS